FSNASRTSGSQSSAVAGTVTVMPSQSTSIVSPSAEVASVFTGSFMFGPFCRLFGWDVGARPESRDRPRPDDSARPDVALLFDEQDAVGVGEDRRLELVARRRTFGVGDVAVDGDLRLELRDE